MSETTTPDGAKPENENKDTTNQETFPDGLGDAGKQALKAERDARKAAEKAKADADKELAELRKAKSDADAAKAAADEEDAKRKGEFEKLANDRAEALNAAKADADAKAKQLERAEKRLQAVVDAGVKRLEETKNEALIAGFPKDAPLLDQAEWLDDPRTVAAIAAASESTKVETAKNGIKVPGTPKPNGNGKQTDEEAKAAQARGYANW